MLIQKSITVNRLNEKNLKKDGSSLSNYVKYLEPLINSRDIQRFNPHSIADCIYKELARSYKTNWIVTLVGNRQKRHRDQKKGIFGPRRYVLKRHTFGTKLKVDNPTNTGYYKQAWYVGDPFALEKDVKNARLYGASIYYMEKNFQETVFRITNRLCQLLGQYYDNKIGYAQMMYQLRQSIYAINMTHNNGQFNSERINIIIEAIKKLCSIGRKNYIAGGPFGRLSGRRSQRTTDKELRPYLFSEFMKSREGRDIITEYAQRVCLELGVKLNNKLKQQFHIAIRRWYWSDKYIQNTKENKGSEVMNILKMGLDKVLLEVMNNNVHNCEDIPVDNYVFSENKTGHYSFSKKEEKNIRINGSSTSSKVHKNITPPPTNSNTLPCGATPKINHETIDTENTACNQRIAGLKVGVGVNPPVQHKTSVLASKLEELKALKNEISQHRVESEEFEEKQVERKRPLTTAEKIKLMGLDDGGCETEAEQAESQGQTYQFWDDDDDDDDYCRFQLA